MNIEKMKTQCGDSNYPSRSKINEIIDILTGLDSANIGFCCRIEKLEKKVKDNEDNFKLFLEDDDKFNGNISTQLEDVNKIFTSLLNSIEMIISRIETLEKKEILKPDYNSDDVKLSNTCIAIEGTFEWALIQMKNGKKVKRKDSPVIIFLSDDKKIMKATINFLIIHDFKYRNDDISLTNWEIYQ